jgi:competence protein ComEC
MASVRGVTPDSAGLVAGLSIGDTSLLTQKLIDDFKILSLTHLTAVSGTNCAIVLALVWLVLGRVRIGDFVVTRWPKLFIAATVLACYVLLVGQQPSILRAGCMTLAVLLAKTLGRPSSAINALALAAAVLLVIDPWLLFDYGFALSALACLGILIVAPKVTTVLRTKIPSIPKWLALGLSVSVSAQLLCLPVLLLLQPGFSTYSVLANLVAEPMVMPVTVLGILAVVCSAVSPPLASFITFVASLFAAPVVFIANRISQFPAATGFWPAGSLGVCMAVILAGSLLLAILSRMKSLRFMGSLMAILCLCAVLALGASSALKNALWHQGDWFVVSCDVGQGDATVIRSKGKIALIDVGREPEPVDNCLSALGIRHIDLLVLTHFDLDHVGGLSGALDGRRVNQAMLTPFLDTRPGANASRAQLERANVPVELAYTGMVGNLGDYAWQVLSPRAGAFEAEDSNDGSITMLWRGSREDIITLADLGEKGQMRLAGESAQWLNDQLRGVPLIMKVSHHGSADQYPELIETLRPAIALISVGRNNSYGHPTTRTLDLLNSIGAQIERTDEHGSISVARQDDTFTLGFQGEQGKAG